MGRIPRSRAIPLLLAGAAALGAVGWSAWIEPRWLGRSRASLSLPRWPDALDGLRVGVIADLHAGAPPVDEPQVRRVVRALNDLQPELVVIVGDFVDGDSLISGRVTPEAVAAGLRDLHAPAGVFGVLGNHDWDYDGGRVAEAAARVGIRMLEDDVARVEVPGGTLWIAGFADASTRRPLVARTLRRIPAEAPVLAVTHSPDLFPDVPDRVSLTVAGHTHGGQVNLPVVRRLLVPSRFGARYAEGHIEEGGRHLFVARGVGTSKLPIRLFARPQVTALDLHAAGDREADARA